MTIEKRLDQNLKKRNFTDASLKRILLCFSFKKINLFALKLSECCCLFLSSANVTSFYLVSTFCTAAANKIAFSIKSQTHSVYLPIGKDMIFLRHFRIYFTKGCLVPDLGIFGPVILEKT